MTLLYEMCAQAFVFWNEMSAGQVMVDRSATMLCLVNVFTQAYIMICYGENVVIYNIGLYQISCLVDMVCCIIQAYALSCHVVVCCIIQACGLQMGGGVCVWGMCYALNGGFKVTRVLIDFNLECVIRIECQTSSRSPQGHQGISWQIGLKLRTCDRK